MNGASCKCLTVGTSLSFLYFHFIIYLNVSFISHVVKHFDSAFIKWKMLMRLEMILSLVKYIFMLPSMNFTTTVCVCWIVKSNGSIFAAMVMNLRFHISRISSRSVYTKNIFGCEKKYSRFENFKFLRRVIN